MGTEDDEVIRFFDDQMLGGVPLRELMRAVATLVDGVVGVQLPDGSTYQAGRTAADVPELRTSLPRGGECWIRTAHGCRELILQRLRVAVPLAVKATELTEAPLRTLLREGGATAAGARALDALGVSPSTSIYAVWLNGESTDRQVLVNHLEALGNQILGRIDDSATTVLAVYAADQEFKVERVPLGIRAAYTGPGALGHADQQWQTLSVAARFALPAARTNGPFAVLDTIPSQRSPRSQTRQASARHQRASRLPTSRRPATSPPTSKANATAAPSDTPPIAESSSTTSACCGPGWFADSVSSS